jgi:hypothetical protein
MTRNGSTPSFILISSRPGTVPVTICTVQYLFVNLPNNKTKYILPMKYLVSSGEAHIVILLVEVWHSGGNFETGVQKKRMERTLPLR